MRENSKTEVRLDAGRKKLKTICTQMKIGEAPPVNPTSDDMRSNSVGLGGGTRFLLMGRLAKPDRWVFKRKRGGPLAPRDYPLEE